MHKNAVEGIIQSDQFVSATVITSSKAFLNMFI